MTIKKRIIAIVLLVLFIVLICPLYILPVSAASDDMTFELDIAKPGISDNNGYIEILFYNNDTNSYFVRTYVWFTNAIGNNVDQTYCQVSVTDDYVLLAPGFHIYDASNIGTVGSRLTYFWASTSGYTNGSSIVQYYNQDSNSLKIRSDNSTVEAVHLYGNFRLMTSYKSNTWFDVLYAEDSATVNKLIDILNLLESCESISLDIWTKLDEILSSTDSIYDKLSDVILYLGNIDLGIDRVNARLDKVINNTDELEKKLDKIIEILESNFDTEVPEDVSKDSLNEHNSLESGLHDSIVNNDYGFDINDVGVDSDFINGEAFQLCWNLVEMSISTHDYIFLIVGLALVVGIIALILNR